MIWLLRHAEAEPGSPDEARKLTPKGEEQARNAGLALARLGVKPDLCLTSPRVRAVQTAELACEPGGRGGADGGTRVGAAGRTGDNRASPLGRPVRPRGACRRSGRGAARGA